MCATTAKIHGLRFHELFGNVIFVQLQPRHRSYAPSDLCYVMALPSFPECKAANSLSISFMEYFSFAFLKSWAGFWKKESLA